MADKIYAVGDIHGQSAMLQDAIARIDRDGGAGSRVVFLGDYCDRGADTKGVIERLIKGRDEGRDWVFLKGNHDRFFEWFIDPEGPRQDATMLLGYHWFHERIGGIQTALSYGVDVPDRIRAKDLAMHLREAVPDSHAAFLRSLKLSHAEDGLFFAHAGVRPGVPLDQQDEEDLLWIRKEFHQDRRDHGAFVIHGHTPVDMPDLQPNRLNLDTGAGYDKPLTTAVFDRGHWYALSPQGRTLI